MLRAQFSWEFWRSLLRAELTTRVLTTLLSVGWSHRYFNLCGRIESNDRGRSSGRAVDAASVARWRGKRDRLAGDQARFQGCGCSESAQDDAGGS